ncbi:MAG: ABC transporter substrate-binding protein [Sphaerochaeta sp.]|jgi:multiple sugar transport system substrate-binding protein|nr:ABC transporter substrate-binding protein [Sphaerochaeta sp.]
MKRVVISVMVLVLVSTLAFAAGVREAKESEVTNIMFYRLSAANHEQYLLPIIEEFEKANPDIKVDSVGVPAGGYEAMASKVLMANAAGIPADIGVVGYSYLDMMVESGNAVDLTPFMEKDPLFDEDSLFPAMFDLGKYNGHQYLIPVATSTPIMMVNKDLFEEVGLDPTKLPRTWAEADAAAQRLADHGYMGTLWGWTITGNWILQTMIENAGGMLATPDSSKILFNEEPGVKTMTYLQDLVRKGLMPVTDQRFETYATGRLGMMIESSFQRLTIPGRTNFETILAPVPTLTGADPVLPAGGFGVMMFSEDPKKQEASWKFLRFLTEETVGMIIGEQSGGYTPANKNVIAKLKAKYADDKNFALTLDQAMSVVPWHAWPGENGNKINQVLYNMTEAVLLQKIAPKAALDKAALDVKALL